MPEVFLCCSPPDREAAETIKARLEFGGDVKVILDEDVRDTVAARWDGGLLAKAILLLLSPDSVPPRPTREFWDTALNHLTSNSEPPLASVLLRDCAHPPLLERKHFFRWDAGEGQTLRAIEEWVMGLGEDAERRSFTPARVPWFEGGQRELDLLWEALVDRAGAAVILDGSNATAKTDLAQEFARQSAGHFRDVLWVSCGDRSPNAIAGDLAGLLGAECRGNAAEAFANLGCLAGRRRLLLVFDEFPPSLAVPADPQGRASVLVATRSAVQAPRSARVISLEREPAARAAVPADPADLSLLRAMAVCRHGGFPLELAAGIAGMDASAAGESCARLIGSRLVAPFDDRERFFRLADPCAAATTGLFDVERRRHAEALHSALSKWRTFPGGCKRYLPEFAPAFRWAVGGDWTLAVSIARYAYAFLRDCGRAAEAVETITALRDAADARGDWTVSDECDWELSWVRGVPPPAGRAPVDADQLGFDFA